MEKKTFWKLGSEHEKEKISKEIENKKYEEYLLNKELGGNLKDAQDEDMENLLGKPAIGGVLAYNNPELVEFEKQYKDFVNEDPFKHNEESLQLTGRIQMLETELKHGGSAFMSAKEVDAIQEEIDLMKKRQEEISNRSNLFKKLKQGFRKS